MATTIVIKNSSVALSAPSAGQLVQGELAVNVTDRKIYTLDGGGNVVLLAAGASPYVTPQIIQVTDNTYPALRITQLGTAAALLVEDSTNPDSTPFVIDANGRTVLGNPTNILTSDLLEIHSTGSATNFASSIFNWSATTGFPNQYFYRSKSGTVGTQGVVASGDNIGAIRFAADDGTAFITTAQIVAQVDGTPGTNDMPGRLVFSTTADGASSPTERMRIDNAGNVGIGVTPATSKGTLQVGTIGYTDTGVVGAFSSSVAGYNQLVLQNTSNNAAASTNLNVSNDAGTSTTNYGELGINSSTFTGTGSFSQAGNVYLASSSTDLAIGTYGANNIHFVVNSGATDAMNISSGGLININSSSAGTSLLTVTTSTSKSALKIPNIAEVATVSATAATGTINYDVTTQSVLYYTTNASGNFTVNFRGSSGTSLNTVMATGESLSVTFLVTNGSTAYYNSAVTVDGSSVTPKWQGGTAPTSGNASSVDSYTYVIIKTGSAAFTVLASQTKFA